MKRSSFLRTGLFTATLCVAGLLSGCAGPGAGSGWMPIVDGGKGMENFTTIGDANWRVEGDAIVADKGKGGYLVTKNSYKDFEIYAEFWAATDTNSGIFIRATDRNVIGADNSYEVNIWDIRPDPTYGTAAIVNFAPVPVPIVYKAGGKWNTLEIKAKGDELVVRFNGTQTVHIRNDKFAQGPIALQYGAGVNGATSGAIKWRKVSVMPL